MGGTNGTNNNEGGLNAERVFYHYESSHILPSLTVLVILATNRGLDYYLLSYLPAHLGICAYGHSGGLGTLRGSFNLNCEPRMPSA